MSALWCAQYPAQFAAVEHAQCCPIEGPVHATNGAAFMFANCYSIAATKSLAFGAA
jgi:hypothetical protein